MSKKLGLAFALTISIGACSAPQRDNVDSTAAGAAAGQIAGPDSLRADSVARADSASRNTNDTSRIGRDTGRQSQAPTPNKQP